MVRYLFLTLFTLMIWASPVCAVSFDIWKTGMARQEVFSLARQHNLPLARSGLIHASKRFNSQLLAGQATSYYYPSTLVGHHAGIHLRFSPDKVGYGQFLYEIEVAFLGNGKNRDLFPYVFKILRGKHGSPARESNILQQHYIWRPEPQGEVRLIDSGNELRITYTDLKIRAFARKLSKSTFELPKDPNSHRDAGKF